MGICYSRLKDCSGVAVCRPSVPRILAIRPWIEDDFFAGVIYGLFVSANDNGRP